jgi:hypothetical protein
MDAVDLSPFGLAHPTDAAGSTGRGGGRPLGAAAALALALTVAPAALHGQRSVLLGTVLSDSTELPLAGAEVVIEALRRSARAAEDGAFVLRGLPAGVHVVTVRGVGYEPLSARVRVTGADTVAADFALGRRAVTLARVDVREAATAVRAMERNRAKDHGGAFIDRETLGKSEHRAMSDVLRRVPGVSIQRVFTPKGSINFVVSSRGTGGGPQGPKWCYYQMYIDGVRVFTPQAGMEPPEIDTFSVHDFEAIEIYRGPAQTPPQYAGTGAICGTVLFWTRTR